MRARKFARLASEIATGSSDSGSALAPPTRLDVQRLEFAVRVDSIARRWDAVDGAGLRRAESWSLLARHQRRARDLGRCCVIARVVLIVLGIVLVVARVLRRRVGALAIVFPIDRRLPAAASLIAFVSRCLSKQIVASLGECTAGSTERLDLLERVQRRLRRLPSLRRRRRAERLRRPLVPRRARSRISLARRDRLERRGRDVAITGTTSIETLVIARARRRRG